MSAERYATGPVVAGVQTEGDAMARDPVCFEAVPDDAPFTAVWQGVRYRFCGQDCAERFRHDPEWYVGSVLAAGSMAWLCRRARDRGEPIHAARTPGMGVRDVVCHMTVALDTPHRLEHEGTVYLFCTARCLERFRQWPQRYRRAHRRSANRATANPPTGDVT